MSYTTTAARILVELLREQPVRIVRREAFRDRWYQWFPQHDVTRRESEAAHARTRLRSYLGEEDHRGYSQGRRGKAYMNEALRQLDREGVLTRTETTVTVVDVPRLVEIANSTPEPDHTPDGVKAR